MIAGYLALTIAAFFAGAAVYVSAVEQPARLMLDDRPLLAEWQPSYKRGAIMQASIAILGGVAGIVAYFVTRDWRWIAGAALLLAPWPYTLLIIMPTNRALEAMRPASAGPKARELIERWGRLHLGRVAFGCAAMLVYLWALAR